MNDEDIIDNELVNKFDAEDTIFNNCINNFSEFPAYITGYNDIVGPYSTKFMSPAYKNLNLDSVFQRLNNWLANIEHHSEITANLMKRDYNYIVTVFEASKQKVESFIFNTGPLPLKTVEYINDTMFYNPIFVNTCEMDGRVKLNNLRYKVLYKEELTQSDALDLIWLVKMNIDMEREDVIFELTCDIWANAKAPLWILDEVRKNLIIWAGKYLSDPDKIKEFKRVIRMSKIEIKPFEEQIRIAKISGELERAEENGKKEGIKEGREEIILELLQKFTPKEISESTSFSVEKILDIQNKNKLSL